MHTKIADPTASASNKFVIPELKSSVSIVWIFGLLAPIVVMCTLGWLRNGEDGLIKGFEPGLFLGFVLAAIFSIAPHLRHLSNQKAHWNRYSYNWYRSAFPQHAHPNGHLTCHSCGGHKTRVDRLMNQTFMRTHSCGQCGTLLYYSKEQT